MTQPPDKIHLPTFFIWSAVFIAVLAEIAFIISFFT